jgi:mannose-1-phosphate guanylyltransferase/mannose-6-phosphate isomerase
MSKTQPPNVFPVILAGGTGSRLWPLSRESLPKQLLNLVGDRTLLQDTVLRATKASGNAPILICSEQHRFLIAEQLRQIGADGCRIALEPVGRNTAPAAAVAAYMVQDLDPEGVVLLLPSDHFIGNDHAFTGAVASAARAAAKGYIATFGIEPSGPETGYGYIRTGSRLPEAPDCSAVDKFVEKPDRELAQQMLAQGGHLWNGGMFAYRPDVFLAELGRLEPKIRDSVAAALKNAAKDLEFLRLEKAAYESAPSKSVDYAVMEHTPKAAVCRFDATWGDLGSWSSIWEVSKSDSKGNVSQGDVMLEDVSGSFVRSDERLTAVVGLDEVIVVSTPDAVLVTSKERAQDVRAIVDRLKAQQRPEYRDNRITHRPWGSFESIGRGERYQVKQIVLKPGASISLQMHHHRAEHWIVVRGTARVTRGEETFLLQENESTFIPLGVQHRLENPGLIPLLIIEVQSGTYLGEDDIVRFEDRYGRAPGR